MSLPRSYHGGLSLFFAVSTEGSAPILSPKLPGLAPASYPLMCSYIVYTIHVEQVFGEPLPFLAVNALINDETHTDDRRTTIKPLKPNQAKRNIKEKTRCRSRHT